MMRKVKVDEKDGQNQEVKPQTSALDSLAKWGPLAIAAIAGAGLAYHSVKKEKEVAMEVDEVEFHKTFENFTRKRQENKSWLDYIIKCLSHETISCNKYNQNGFAPLHLACQEGNVTAVQALLPFNPDLQLKSACGKTAYELVQESKSTNEKNAERVKELNIVEYMLKALDDGIYLDSSSPWPIDSSPTGQPLPLETYKIPEQSFIFFNPDPNSIPQQRFQTPRIRILCIDGGGTRGFVPLEFLDFIENWVPPIPPSRARQCTPDGDQLFTIKRSFDWVAGTSTGGIIALYLALGNSVRDCRRLYFQLKDVVFTGAKPYNAEKYESILKETFGEKRMRDIEGIKCAITATTGTAERLTSILFTNYDEKTKDEFIWKVARMTSSAPYFFNPYLHDDGHYYYDGGLTANNPTQAILSEITKRKENLTNGILVSLGTGKPPLTGNVNLNFSNRMGLVGTLGIALKTLINQVCQSDGECINYAMTTCSLAHCSYYRLTPTLPEDIVLDETDNEKLLNMIYHTKAYIKRFKLNISEMCARLMAVTEESGSCVIV